MALRLWGSKTPGNVQHARDVNLLKNKKKVLLNFIYFERIVSHILYIILGDKDAGYCCRSFCFVLATTADL